MVKKKQRSAGDGGVDIKSLIHDHSLFFDRLVELIPAKFYLPTDDNHEKVWFQGLSKKAKEKAKKATIANTKKARRNRLDPENSSKTTLDLLKESLADDARAKAEAEAGDASESRSVTYEELRQRLRRKIEELRGGRGGDEESRMEKEEERKRKREDWMKKKEEKGKAEAIEKEVSAAAEGIEFGKVKLGDGDWEINGGKKKKNSNKKRKLSKEEELDRARKREEEAKKDPAVAEKHSWEAATNRAMGEKVHDKPRLIKESIQKEKRRHQKSVDKWKDRVKNTENSKKERQDKRKGNIQSVIDKKKAKKIERREKKLMKRPGFEGRKDGYINGD